jgi:hypothetical protein
VIKKEEKRRRSEEVKRCKGKKKEVRKSKDKEE